MAIMGCISNYWKRRALTFTFART